MIPSTTANRKNDAKYRIDEFLRPRASAVDKMFSPESICVIGASEKSMSVGRTLFENLQSKSFKGRLFPVNPKRKDVLGCVAFPSVREIPEPVDLAVIATPRETVPAIVKECAECGVKGAIIISAGFKECGVEGRELERQVLANRREMRIVGPNCLGVMMPHAGLNATFAPGMARPGNVAFLSQSGALCSAALDWSVTTNLGFSAMISVGSMADIGWADLIYYLGDDPHTRSIVIYMESVGDARSFLSAAREVALSKPIIVLKVGRTAAAAKAAASHTGSLTGCDAVLDAAFARVGVLRVHSIGELFAMADVLGKQQRPLGPRLGIVTNAGGPGGLATDALIENGGMLASFSKETISTLNEHLPQHWSHENPADILGDADCERYATSVEAVLKDSECDGGLVILTPQAVTNATATAWRLVRIAERHTKPLLASWMGGHAIAAGEKILIEAGIPTFANPDAAAQAFAGMWQHSQRLNNLYETPVQYPDDSATNLRETSVASLLASVLGQGRQLLTEPESKEVIAAYGIQSPEIHTAASMEAAVAAAERLGYPVVAKVWSESVTHKSDVGGVKLDLMGPDDVRNAWHEIVGSVTKLGRAKDFLGVTIQKMAARQGIELIIGSSIDPQFGPVLAFGEGGTLVEIHKDTALALPPLTSTLARRLIEQTRIFEALKGIRGAATIDLDALAGLLVRFSRLVTDHPIIKEIEINPLLVTADAFTALDARVILHDSRDGITLPKPAIRPCPNQYFARWALSEGTAVSIRPIRPEDEPKMIDFHRTLSELSVRRRYFSSLTLEQRTAHDRLRRVCFCDYDRELALVVERKLPHGGTEIIGVGRLSKLHHLDEAEFSMIISDGWQGCGLGTQLLRLLQEAGRREKLRRIAGFILPDNPQMLHICKKTGFQLINGAPDEEIIAEFSY